MRMLIKKTRHNGFKVYVRVMVLRWVRNSRVLARASIFLDLRLSDDVNVIQPFVHTVYWTRQATSYSATVAAVRIWNSLPQHITSAPSLPVFCSRLKTYDFFELCFPQLLLLRPRRDTVIYGHVNRSLTYSTPGREWCLRQASKSIFGLVGPCIMTFWPPKFHECPCLVDNVCHLASKSLHSCLQVWYQTNEGRKGKDERPGREHLPPPRSLA